MLSSDFQWVIITDHRYHNKYNISKDVWNTVRIMKMWHGDSKWAKAVGKIVQIDLLDAQLPPSFSL